MSNLHKDGNYDYLPCLHVRPQHLVIGGCYLHSEPHRASESATFNPVIVLAYDACPAFVIIQSETDRLRCLRQELFDPLESA